MPDDPDLRRRIEALQDDSELRKLAASARPRAPAADVDQDGAGKAELRDRLRRMAEAATAGPEREAEDAARERMAGDTQHPAAAQRKRRRKAATAKPDPGALLTDLQNARTAGEVLGAAARLCWAEAHDGAECPGHRIPAPADLADWVPMASPAVLAECAMLNAEAVTAAAGEVLSWPPAGDWPPALTDSLDSRQGARAAYALAAAWLFGSAEPGAAGVAWLLPRVHAAWLTIPAAVRTRHPAAPLVAGWQAAPVIVKADRRAHAILPATLRDLKRDPAVLPLGLDRTTPLGPVQDPEQGYLPGMEPAPSIVPPVPWLTLYDLTGVGPVQTRGRGAPLAQRLLVEVLTAVLLGDRDPEWSTAPPLTLRDLFDWCWPRYYDAAAARMRGGYDRSKHLAALQRALVELDNMRLVLPGDPAKLARRLIRVDDLPTPATPLDTPIRFHVRHLPGSDRGPMFERAAARRWGVVSAPAWRASIRLAYLWDEAKRRNHGARVYATRPVVARAAGPGSPLIGTDGKPLRDRRGAVVTDWSDRRAVILGADGKPAGDGNPPAFERNPAADRVPVLGPADLARLTFDDALPAGAALRKRIERAREALAAKAAAGEIVREIDEHGGERIIEARPQR